MINSGAVVRDSHSAPAPAPLRALRERAGTVLPGLYAWLTTVLLPCVQHGASTSARLCAVLAVLALFGSPLFLAARPRVARGLGIYGFIGCSLLSWLLLGAALLQNPADQLLSALGAVAFALYALGWGSLRRRGAVPEDGPHVIAGPPLQPRARPPALAPFVFAVLLVGALVPVFLAFRVADPDRGLFAHAAAVLSAILTVTVGARVALGLGQHPSFPAVSERLNAAAVPLALLALAFGLGFLWLVLR